MKHIYTIGAGGWLIATERDMTLLTTDTPRRVLEVPQEHRALVALMACECARNGARFNQQAVAQYMETATDPQPLIATGRDHANEVTEHMERLVGPLYTESVTGTRNVPIIDLEEHKNLVDAYRWGEWP
jgi:hypothetical protein